MSVRYQGEVRLRPIIGRKEEIEVLREEEGDRDEKGQAARTDHPSGAGGSRQQTSHLQCQVDPETGEGSLRRRLTCERGDLDDEDDLQVELS